MHDETDIGSQCISSGGSDHEHPWIPDTSRMGVSSMDWVVTPFGTDVITDVPDFVMRHVSGCNVASAACSNLKQERKNATNHAKSIAKSGDPDKEDKMLACDGTQHALKIAANSLCGCLCFRSHNACGPRCAGVSVAQTGTHGITALTCMVVKLGCIPVCGDADSAMHAMKLRKPSKNSKHFATMHWPLFSNDVTGIRNQVIHSLLGLFPDS
jgi:hypothetical protein